MPEKDELKFGFIKLTDMAPLAIAKEKGFFEDEGLYVTLEPQANWKVLLDRVITGELDGAHMLAGQPLAATIGFGTKAAYRHPLLDGPQRQRHHRLQRRLGDDEAECRRSRTASRCIPIKADALKPVIDKFQADGKPFNMGMVFPVSTHNYELRYWLAAGDIHPGLYSPSDTSGQIKADVLLSVTPPPQMPATLEAGTIHGYCVGEPWNQAAVFKGIGVPVDHRLRDLEEQSGEGLRHHRGIRGRKSQHDARHHQGADPRRHVARRERQRQSHEGGRDPARSPNMSAPMRTVIANSMTGTFEYEKGDKRAVPDFNVFFRHFATYPYYSDAVWYLTQMRRWGQIAEAKPDGWYDGRGQVGLPPGRLPEGGEAPGRRGQGQGSRLPVGQRRLSRADLRFHRRHRLRRPQAQRLHRLPASRTEGPAEA